MVLQNQKFLSKQTRRRLAWSLRGKQFVVEILSFARDIEDIEKNIVGFHIISLFQIIRDKVENWQSCSLRRTKCKHTNELCHISPEQTFLCHPQCLSVMFYLFLVGKSFLCFSTLSYSVRALVNIWMMSTPFASLPPPPPPRPPPGDNHPP